MGEGKIMSKEVYEDNQKEKEEEYPFSPDDYETTNFPRQNLSFHLLLDEDLEGDQYLDQWEGLL